MSKNRLALSLMLFLAPVAAMACNHCGHIRSMDPYTTSGNKTGGTIAGALIGGALGNQVGKGDGRKAATVAGAVGGAYAGREIAERSDRTRWRIRVKFDDGHSETLDQGSSHNLHVGDYVKVRNGKAYRL